MTLWVKPDTTNSAILIDRSHYAQNGTMDSGWNLGYFNNKVDFTISIGGTIENVQVAPVAWEGNWHFISVRYEGSTLSLSVDNENATASVSGSIDNASNRPLLLASGQNTAYFNGKMDEIKIFGVALGDDEITTLKAHDEAGDDYTGIQRGAVSCVAAIEEHTWELIGIPADFRSASNTKTTVADIFDDDMGGTYGTDWRVYRRDYNTTDNNSSYHYMALGDTLKFGAGYWLGSKINGNWSENGAVSVDYNSSTNGTNDCPAERCVEIWLTPVSLDNTATPPDDLNGSGPYRYYMTGFIGKIPVNWADCRLIISDADGSNRELMTPSDANATGYMANEIWKYDPNSSGYATCTDTDAECKLEPYKGFWVELHGPTKNKTVKLLIPKE
jgi:hypothetical protein